MKFNEKYLTYFVLILLLLGLFMSIDTMELRAEEPRRALVTLEMMINNDRIHPSLNGQPYLHKPPFFNWVLEASFQLTGSTREWAVRLPSIIGYLLTAFSIFLILKDKIGKNIALIASLFFLFSADLLFYGTVNSGEMDLFLTLPVFFQIIALPYFFQKKNWLTMFLVSYFFMAIVFLTKHFAAFAFQALAIFALMISEKNWRLIFSWQHIMGVLFLIALVGSYFFAYAIEEPLTPLIADLFSEVKDKSEGKGMLNRILYMIKYPFIWIKIVFPWSLLFFFLYKIEIRSKLMLNPYVRFSAIFAVLNVCLYWFLPETRDRYLYPLLPIFCISLAFIFQQIFKGDFKKILWACIFMGFLRIGYNWFIMPIQQENRDERKSAFEVLDKADGEIIYLTGWEFVLNVEKNIFGHKLFEEKIRFPPAIPYGIPYIITRETGQIVQFEPEPEKGKLYLAPAPFIKGKNVEVLYTVPVNYIEGGLLLCRFK